jgi:hypothetical protein
MEGQGLMNKPCPFSIGGANNNPRNRVKKLSATQTCSASGVWSAVFDL